MEQLLIPLIGQVAGATSTLITSYNERKNQRDQIRLANENKYIKTYDYQAQTLEEDNTGLIALTIMSVIVIALVIAVIFKNK